MIFLNSSAFNFLDMKLIMKINPRSWDMKMSQELQKVFEIDAFLLIMGNFNIFESNVYSNLKLNRR